MKVYFIAKRTGPTRLFDDKGLIGTFVNTGGSTVRMSDGMLTRADDQTWLMTLEDPELVERAKLYPGYGQLFKQVTHAPDQKGKGNIMQGAAGNVTKIREEAEAEAKRKYEGKIQGYRRYYELKSKLLKSDETYRADALPEDKSEFENLKKELAI